MFATEIFKLLLIFNVLQIKLSAEELCNVFYDDRYSNTRVNCVIFQEKNSNENERNVLNCDENELLYFNSTNRYTELRFENCSIYPEVFLSLPISNVLRFISKQENPVLRNNSFQGICLVLEINLSYNKIKIVQPSAFHCNKVLRKLYLSNNLIENLPDSLFKDQYYLDVLDLSHNHLKSLSLTLKYLVLLKELSLKHNYLKNTSYIAISDFKFLTLLELSHNPGLILDENLFESKYQLLSLFLDNCNISFLPDKIFEKSKQIQFLYLNHNQLESINPSHFQNLKNLKILTLTSNQISAIENETFRENTFLTTLVLSENRISHIEEENFLGLYSLKYLDLSQNAIQKVDSFSHLKRLQYLNISHNLLSSLHYNAFEHNSEVTDVDISYNYLTDIRNIKWQHMKYLNSLIITHNNIKQLLIPEVKYGLQMHLENNKVQSLYISRRNFIELKSPAIKLELFLSGNLLHCDCKSYELFSVLKGRNSISRIDFVDGLICHYPEKLHKVGLNSLNSSDFECTSCPARCHCEFNVYDYVENKINCNKRNYTVLPVVTSQNASILDVSQNYLKSLAGLNQSCWENLLELNAENNEIISDEFYIPDKLVFLGLKGNKMNTLPIAIQKHAANKNDFKMTLSRNMWSCNCSVLPFKSFISAHRYQIVDVNEIRCILSNKSVNKDILMSMKVSDLCPEYEYYLTISSYIIAASFLAIAIVLPFYYRHKTHILSFMYTHCNGLYMFLCCDNPNSEERMFDCFISYSSKDSDVAFAIVDELENKPPTFRFCVHERNWLPGEYITKNIVTSIQNSRKTLIVLSKEFVRSQWFHFEFQAAFRQTLQDKQNRLIFVLKGELPDESEMEDDVLNVLSTVTYLKWEERWFWEKLRYALHERKSFWEMKYDCGLKGCFQKESLQRNSDISLRVPVRDEIL